MAFPALAYYETSIGNPVRNLLKQFLKSENEVIWRYDVIMTSKIGIFDTFKKKLYISAIMTPIMAFLALAYYLTSIGNSTRNLLKPFSKS